MSEKLSKIVLPIKNESTGVTTNKEFDVGGSGNTNTFVGTTAEWNALTTEQQNVYDCRVLTDDDLDTKSVIDNLNSDSSTDALSAKQGKVLAQLFAPVLSTLVAPAGGLAIGDQFVYNGLLYKATAEIAEGGTITIDGNCALADSVTEQLKVISADLSNYVRAGSTATVNGTIVKFKNIVFISGSVSYSDETVGSISFCVFDSIFKPSSTRYGAGAIEVSGPSTYTTTCRVSSVGALSFNTNREIKFGTFNIVYTV